VPTPKVTPSPSPTPLPAKELARRQHELDANAAVSTILVLVSKRDFASAANLARTAAKDFDDTSFGNQLDFLRFKTAGLEAMSKRDYPGAGDAFKKALAVKDEAETRDLLKQANDLARRPEPTPKK
jgi:hypothetical protein